MSPLEYINVVRIQAACEYLKKTDEPVAMIAQSAGLLSALLLTGISGILRGLSG